MREETEAMLEVVPFAGNQALMVRVAVLRAEVESRVEACEMAAMAVTMVREMAVVVESRVAAGRKAAIAVMRAMAVTALVLQVAMAGPGVVVGVEEEGKR